MKASNSHIEAAGDLSPLNQAPSLLASQQIQLGGTTVTLGGPNGTQPASLNAHMVDEFAATTRS